MKTNYEKVKEFMITGEQHVPDRPTIPNSAVVILREKLIQEELDELKASFQEENIVEVADAIADLLYVVYGAGAACGLPVDEIFAEVHRSNMTKFPNGKVLKNEYGKIIKPDTYEQPNLGKIINQE